MKVYHDPTMKMFLEEVRNFKSVTIFEVNNYYQGYRKGFYQILHERTVKRLGYNVITTKKCYVNIKLYNDWKEIVRGKLLAIDLEIG